MDFSRIPVIAAIKGKMGWLQQRQTVVADNIANADTPAFRASDLKPFAFRELVRQPPAVALARTAQSHLGGEVRERGPFAERTVRKPYETTPTGNGVVLEEQMAKANEIALAHDMASELYRKQLGLFRLAIGRTS